MERQRPRPNAANLCVPMLQESAIGVPSYRCIHSTSTSLPRCLFIFPLLGLFVVAGVNQTNVNRCDAMNGCVQCRNFHPSNSIGRYRIRYGVSNSNTALVNSGNSSLALGNIMLLLLPFSFNNFVWTTVKEPVFVDTDVDSEEDNNSFCHIGPGDRCRGP